MCFDLDSEPPIEASAEEVDVEESIVLTAADGNRFLAFHARPAHPSGNAIVILPDVRGLHHYYEHLALRFAEAGVEAVALDYFGRSAGTTSRDDTFDYGPHVGMTTWAGLSADITAAAGFLRGAGGTGTKLGSAAEAPRAIFTIGFCMGGRNAYLSSTLGLGLAGVIGFYGWPSGPSRNDTPAPVEMVGRFECPILGVFGGADQNIPVSVVRSFRDALAGVAVEHEIVVEPDAPHGFFDRKQAEFQAQSDDAWSRVRRFIDAHGAALPPA
jgi:carboxymethylenebutenolidase